MEKPTRSRVYCCITRPGRRQVLVFSHPDEGVILSGVQTPGGSIEPGELPRDAAIREAWEESGIREFSAITLVAQDEFENHDENLSRYFFQLVAPADTPDEWIHTVGGTGDDQGMPFSYRWVECPGYGDLAPHFHAYLDQLSF